MLDIIDNKFLRKRGIWVRPDVNEHGCNYEKLLAIQYPDKNCLAWISSKNDKFTSNEKSHVLSYNRVKKFWNLVETTAADDLDIVLSNLDTGKQLFMNEKIKSFNETLETKDLIWVRFPTVNDLFEDYLEKDIIWRIRKMWSNNSQYSTGESLEKEIWLDKLEIKNDGSYVWTSSEYDFKECSITKGPSMLGFPHETISWTIDIPIMFQFPTHALALNNSRSLLLSYVVNSPLNIKYCIADAIKK